ncbi:hypothetical protein ONS95_003608 [Cadophora gregata]|uniref:uncharacterized protein n=1 Tax=Cadophora gregata TaxID=51156 RepID=UPI0026DBACEC|nr:uncharacterized protein ONS95_003608 [Cadophora gregata]KAK0106889.1 hypothetical protein ONS95_003608 [Cadophora gregata]KAK0116578.1 hypothetical protein ONS96_012435 [Cadophora gregata f. sp. sojae]
MKLLASISQTSHFFTATLLLLLITLVSATPSDLDAGNVDLTPHASLPEGYTEGDLRMTGTFADNIAINHTGTIEQIFAQLAIEHPNINFTELALATPNMKTIEKRTKSDLNCIPVSGQNWYPAKDWAIINGIDYLQKVTASCGVGAHKCSRVSCSYNSGIRLCNNNDYERSFSCTWIASFAEDIRENCRYRPDPHGIDLVGGQAWDTENYNVCVFQERC